MIFIIGGQGRLGRAIASSYPHTNVILIEREIYQDWWQQGSQKKVLDFFKPYSGTDSVIYVTSGILDPKAPHEEHFRVNYMLPKHIIEGAADAGTRVVTFGTVMERLIRNKNSYIETKTMLGDYVYNLATTGGQALHIRIHTLYGLGQPSPFMFLGQINKALIEQTTFKMTSGKQLREYHHINDEVVAIRKLVDSREKGVINLNHGDPVSLKDIAEDIFKAFHSEKNLCVGALQEPSEENYESIFQRPEFLNDVNFRDSLPAITAYMKECVQETKENA